MTLLLCLFLLLVVHVALPPVVSPADPRALPGLVAPQGDSEADHESARR